MPSLGSTPRVSGDPSTTPAPTAAAGLAERRAHPLPTSGPGSALFLAGLFGLVVSVTGLVTIGIRRRQW